MARLSGSTLPAGHGKSRKISCSALRTATTELAPSQKYELGRSRSSTLVPLRPTPRRAVTRCRSLVDIRQAVGTPLDVVMDSPGLNIADSAGMEICLVDLDGTDIRVACPPLTQLEVLDVA